jgi:sec-independent protein translocase protein TatA
MSPGPFEILVVLILIVLVFGSARVPAIAENLAKGLRSFKRGLKDEDKDPALSRKSDKQN